MDRTLLMNPDASWQQRFRAPAIFRTQLARALPTRGLVASNNSGVIQLYAWDVLTGKLLQLTDHPQGMHNGFLSPDGRFVYYHVDRQGNELGHFVRIPFEGGDPEDITPDIPPYAAFNITRLSHVETLLSFIAVNSQGFGVYCLDVEPDGRLSAPRLIYRTSLLPGGPLLARAGDLIALSPMWSPENAHTRVLVLDTSNGKPIAELSDGPARNVKACLFSPLAGDHRLLATTDKTGVKRPFLWNPWTQERTELALDHLEGEVVPLDWSSDGQRLLLCQFTQAVQHLFTYTLSNHTPKPLQHPAGSFSTMGGMATGGGEVYFGPDHEIFAQWQDSTHPSRLIALNSETGARTRTVLTAGEVPAGHPWQSITFPSADGQRIQGWLGLPDGSGPFPTILEVHGGPSVVVTNTFSPISQAWLDQGFAYLTINYQGSPTFGREFEQKIWGHPGHWELEDIAAARHWLIEQGIARPDQVLLTGWSYGGFLTLLAMGKQPELWAGGIAGVAIADFVTLYQDMRETLRSFARGLFGGTPEEKPALYAQSSPIRYVEHVQAPVLVIQERHDTRTPARQMELYEEHMRAAGKDIEIKWFDAGHLGSLVNVEQAIEQMEWMVRFAQRVLWQ
jgi:dipeptidyl aminopeptidase/acylaminoacyl peptidase